MRPLKRQQGYLLITVVVTLFLVSSIVMLLVYDSANSARSASGDLEAARAEYVAQAGMQNALWRAQNNACVGNLDVPTTTLGKDSYEATITGAATGSSVTLSADQDAWIRSDDTTKNNGTATSNHVRFESSKIEQVLTRFDVSSIASKAQISSAIAWFHLKAGKVHPEGPISVHEILADWQEKSVTWESFNSAYRAAPLSAIPAQGSGDTWVAVNVTGLVQAWVNGQPNRGILFNSTAEGMHTEYTAREDSTNPPRLEVTIGGGAPSPVTIKAKGRLASGVGRSIKDKLATTWQPTSETMLQPGASLGVDAWVTSGQTAWNYGAMSTLSVQPGSQRTFLRMDFQGQIPIGARVTRATLELWTTQVNTADAIDLHRVARPWEEGSCFGNCGPDDGVTWNTYDGASSWATPGGDIDAKATASATPTSNDAWLSWDVTDLAAAWAADPSSNFGVLLRGNPGDATFASSDNTDPNLHPRMTIEYACECGNPCMPPRGSGTILLVRNQNDPTSIDTDNQARLESWGYTVNLINDWATQSEYNAAFASNDVVLISGASPFAVGTKLTNATIGVVNSRGELNDELGIASGYSSPVSSQLDVVDNSHYITAIVPTGTIDIYASSMAGLAISGAAPTGAHELGNWGGNSAIVALDQGGDLSGGGNAAGRRVLLPIGATTPVSWRHVNNTGELILQRSIDWAMGVEGKSNTTGILLVVGNASNPSSDDAARKALIESWGMTVTLIDDGADAAKFKSEMATTDVVYISGSASPTGFVPSLSALPTPIVNEQIELHDELGFSSSSGSNAFDKIFVENNSHSITTGFSTGWLTIATASQALYSLEGTLAPGMNTLATTWINGANYKDGLALLEAGASLYNGGSAAGRRAQLPWGAGGFSFASLNANGQLIMQRAIEWAAGPEVDVGPIAHWKLDETSGTTAIDSEGGHDGTASNTEWVTGQLNGAIRLNSASDAVVVPHADDLSITGALTITAWINKAGLSLYDAAVAKATSGSDLNYFLGTWENYPVFGFSTSTDNWQGYYATSAPLVTNNWYHLAASFDNAADQVRIYVDGIMVDEFSTTLEPVTNAGNIRLGRSAIGEYWPGLLDDVRIYDRVLSANEIQELAQRPAPVPVAHWQLDENTGSTTVDSLGGRVGTLTNGATWAGGALGSGVRFDGSNDRINVLHDNGLNLVSEMTLSAWIYADSLKPFQMVLTKGDNGVAENYWLATEGNKLNFGFIDSGLYAQYTSSSLTLEAGRWHHVAATFDNAADEVVLYVDGSSQTFSSTYTPAANNEQLIIGSSYYGGESFDGVIDDVRIYNAVLGAQEISDLAASGGGGGGGAGGGGASYVEKNHVFTISGNNSWQTVDLSSQGVPPNAVVEIAMENTKTNAQREAGVRAVGGSGPTYDLHEPEGGGVDALTKHVQADASGQIQAFAENSAEVQFRLLGYWTGGSYSNTDGLFTSSTSNSWRLHNMTSFGIQPEQVVEFIVQNTSGGAEYRGGVRNVGSGHAQMMDLHEAEAGGKDFHSVFVRAANNVSAAIEAYAENTGSIEFKPAGMWTTPPGTYTQHDATVDLGRPTANNTWQTVDLAPFGVPPNAVVQITLANRNSGGERRMGVRAVGSSLDRYVDLHEAEGGGEDLVTMHVKADASSRIQWYHERPADSHRFYLMGWWVLN